MSAPKKLSLLLLALVASLQGCQAPQPQAPEKPEVAITVSAIRENRVTSETSSVIPLSPLSTEGLKQLSELRNHNSSLAAFLDRNRKPDYFFSSNDGIEKTYLIYLASDNLYVFNQDDAQAGTSFRKFHPVPPSILATLQTMYHEASVAAAPDSSEPVAHAFDQAATASVEPPSHLINDAASSEQIEHSLAERNPEPGLTNDILKSIPTAESGLDADNRLYIKTYYVDKSLEDLLENEYAAKYDAQKQNLKFSLPQAYDAKRVYRQANFEARKIYLFHSNKTGAEMSLVVPDFMPGSTFYASTHNTTLKAFASLYQVNVPQEYVSSDRLRMRFAVKLCQRDNASFCAANNGEVTLIRAIVIAATLYDSVSKQVIDTYVLK